jgi:uncharacterized protein (TIGR00369 family)
MRTPPTKETLALYSSGFNGSATLQHFGAVISFPTIERVRAVIDPIKPEHRGGLGSDAAVNGGVLAAMFDLVLGCSAALVDPTKRTATMQLSMSFMKPLKGNALVAEAWIDRAGRDTLFCSAQIANDAGEITARASGVVKLTDVPWFGGSSPAIN